MGKEGELIIGDSSSDEEENKQTFGNPFQNRNKNFNKPIPIPKSTEKEWWIGDSSSDEEEPKNTFKKPPPIKPAVKKEVVISKPKPRQVPLKKEPVKPKATAPPPSKVAKPKVSSGVIGDSSSDEEGVITQNKK